MMQKTSLIVIFLFVLVAFGLAAGMRAPKEYDPVAINNMTQQLENRIRRLEQDGVKTAGILVSKAQPYATNDGTIWANPNTGQIKILVNNSWVTPFIKENDDSDDITEGTTNLFWDGDDFKDGAFNYFSPSSLTDTIFCAFDLNAYTYCNFTWADDGVPPDTSAVYYTINIASDYVVWHRFTTTGGLLYYSYQIWEQN